MLSSLVHVVYGAIAVPLMERKLHNNRKKSRISEKKASYRNLQVRNLEKLASVKQTGKLNLPYKQKRPDS